MKARCILGPRLYNKLNGQESLGIEYHKTFSALAFYFSLSLHCSPTQLLAYPSCSYYLSSPHSGEILFSLGRWLGLPCIQYPHVLWGTPWHMLELLKNNTEL